MARYTQDKQFFHGKEQSLGILLVNLGTPDEPDTRSVRRYLKQFLSDDRVVEIPKPIWWMILNGIILRTRPAKSAELYKSVWTDKGSPLLQIGIEQCEALQKELSLRFPASVTVKLAMRYGNPSIAQGLTELRDSGMQRLLVLPLYPQYSAATTATTYDAVSAEFRRWRYLPEVRFVNQYHDEPAYIEALAKSVRQYWDANGRQEKLLMSFHGLPRRNLDLGDPYHCQCYKTGRLLAEALDLRPDEWKLSFQSRFGRAEWLKPYTDKTLEELAAAGIKGVDVVCPGFAADCLETLQEMELENREVFEEAGGETYNYIPALNAGTDHIRMLADLVQRHTQGWPETSPDWSEQASAAANKQSQQLASERGAKR